MTMRVTLLMEFGRQAWGETHYDTLANTIDGAFSRAQTLAGYRAACLGFDAAVFAVRVSDPDNAGSSDLIEFNPPIGGQKVTISTGALTSFTSDSCGQANDAVMVDAGSLLSGHFYRSRPMLGAPPFGLIQSANGVKQVRTDICPAWKKAFDDLKNEMINGGYGFRCKVEGTSYPASGVTGGGGLGPIGITCSNAFSPTPQTLVHVRGFRSHPSTRVPLAGMWRVLSVVVGPIVGTSSILLANSENWPPGSSYRLPGSIQTAAGFITNYTQFNVDTGATRKRGGNIELPRGRSRTRLSPGF